MCNRSMADMLLADTDVTVRPLSEGYVVALSEEYEYPSAWHDDRSIQANGDCAARASCVTDTDDLALRIELHDHTPGQDTSHAWQFDPEDVVLSGLRRNRHRRSRRTAPHPTLARVTLHGIGAVRRSGRMTAD
jgi:hypothetical protein